MPSAYAASRPAEIHSAANGNPLPRPKLLRSLLRGTVASALALLCLAGHGQTSSFTQTNLISDGAVPALKTDPTLINPWGVSIGQAFWIDSPGSGFSLVDDANGNKQFAVAVPPAASTSSNGSPAGTVFNNNAAEFTIPNSGSASFLFGTLDGTIAGWNTSTPRAVTVVNNSAQHASYTDVALDNAQNGTVLLAANFAAGTVDVFDSNFKATHLAGSFKDPSLPGGYAPFGIHSIGSNVFVTYAQVNPANGRETVGAGLGFVDEFDVNGKFVARAISQGSLNAPWGMALAPAGFGSFAGDLLVGNFGDGTINAYDASTFALKGQLADASGKPITNTGLWEIVFGQNGVGEPNTLYIAAGINGGKDGLFAAIKVAAPGAGAPSFAFQTPPTSVTVTNGTAGSLSLTLAGSNGFNGQVSFSCSGLPTGDSCTFTPSTVNLSGTTAASVSVSVSTTATTAPSAPVNPYVAGGGHGPLHTRGGVTMAFLGPLSLLSLLGMRRRSLALHGALTLGMLTAVTFAAVGCAGSMPTSAASATTPTTPTTTPFTINAVSASTTVSTPVTLTTK